MTLIQVLLRKVEGEAKTTQVRSRSHAAASMRDAREDLNSITRTFSHPHNRHVVGLAGDR